MRVIAALLFFAARAWPDGISGQVLEDHTGAALPSADLKLRRAGVSGLAAELETDREGKFLAPTLPAGGYRVEVSKPSHIPTTLSFRVTDVSRPLVVRLVRCGVISGQVLDGQAQPIRSAIVRAIVKPADGAPLRPYFEISPGYFAHVNDRGEYRLFNLPPGQYVVAVSYGASTLQLGSTGNAPPAPGVGSGTVFYPSNARPNTFAISGGEDYRGVNFTIISAALFSISGAIGAPGSAKGLQPGRFWLTLVNPDQPGLSVAATNDKDGAFKFDGIAPGSYDVLASGPSTARIGRGSVLPNEPLFGRTHVEVAGQNIENLSIPMSPGRSQTFLVRAASDAKDCPQKVRVGIQSTEDWAAILDRSTEFTVGQELTINNLAPARYYLAAGRVSTNCYVGAAKLLDLTGADDRLEVTLTGPGAVRGRLDAGSAKASDFVVVLLPATAHTEAAAQIVFPGADSRFAFTGLAPGKYRIAAQPAGESKARWVANLAQAVEFDVRGGATAEIDLAAPVVKP